MSRDQLISGIGTVLCALSDDAALLPALIDLEQAAAPIREELTARSARRSLPADCTAGHSWQIEHGVKAETRTLVERRRCVVCGLAEEIDRTPKPYRRGRKS
ncbi:MAG: hypothetical protein B7Y12_02030 [Rhizobiales bacterium 24-66-13]|jgi:hypothetical protein|nr:MAG: hypothetical protein B7Y61_01060 [Rhizobiales bacterium 35-66-30]OYZ82794.1 MAG: hypothetical protein B7Y12_02030 [Rhizobiales bacterium 24-66-13]OZB11827.1 MAG: hypothetical protein B7X67_02010 [Rhizobiales bacterium 39-66-18]HQS09500.1 hypothetical protein [Xanthobacteraceae bacterium]HQS46797.1 hypothetical protein [Xanthobacteraceae bacterium]